jgi:hybrid cluster-associated redox disulfide protein
LRYRNDAASRSAHTNVMTLAPELTIAALLATHPKAVHVLIRHRMLCVGCLMARFETVHDAAAVYRLDERELLDEIERESTP